MIIQPSKILKSLLIICLLGPSLGIVLQHRADRLENGLGLVPETDIQTSQPSPLLQADSPTPSPSVIPSADAQVTEEAGWPMAGANPERTSWTAEEVRGDLKPL